MNETIINGIDVSKPVLTATNNNNNNNNNNVYYSQKAVDELQNVIKRLQEENEGLKSLNDFNVQKIEVLQEENEKLKAENEQLKKPCLIMPKVKQLAVPIEKYEKLYKALEEIRNIAETPIIADKNRFDEITNKINEVLNDRY